MAINYTEEQLNSVDKSFLIQLLLQQQEQLNALTKELHASNEKMQLLKRKGKKEADISDLPVRRIDHYLSDEELEAEFGVKG